MVQLPPNVRKLKPSTRAFFWTWVPNTSYRIQPQIPLVIHAPTPQLRVNLPQTSPKIQPPLAHFAIRLPLITRPNGLTGFGVTSHDHAPSQTWAVGVGLDSVFDKIVNGFQVRVGRYERLWG